MQAMKRTANNAANGKNSDLKNLTVPGQELVGVLDGFRDELLVLKQTVAQYTETNEQDKRNRLMPGNKDRSIVSLARHQSLTSLGCSG